MNGYSIAIQDKTNPAKIGSVYLIWHVKLLRAYFLAGKW